MYTIYIDLGSGHITLHIWHILLLFLLIEVYILIPLKKNLEALKISLSTACFALVKTTKPLVAFSKLFFP